MSSSPIFLSFFLILSSVSAFNITLILDDYPDFATFNDLLTQTRVADMINSRRTITIFAVDNGAISPLSGMDLSVQRNVLKVHVILDYYDEKKIRKSPKRSRLVTTLFQSSGIATNQQGFINITVDKKSDEIMIGSAVPGSGLNARLVGEVVTHPYNISVLQLSTVIIPDGIANGTQQSKPSAKAPSTAPSEAPSDAPAKAPSKAPSKKRHPKAPASEESPSEAPAPDSADAPVSADAPASVDAPAADDSGASAAGDALGTCLGAIVGMACMAFL